MSDELARRVSTGVVSLLAEMVDARDRRRASARVADQTIELIGEMDPRHFRSWRSAAATLALAAWDEGGDAREIVLVAVGGRSSCVSVYRVARGDAERVVVDLARIAELITSATPRSIAYVVHTHADADDDASPSRLDYEMTAELRRMIAPARCDHLILASSGVAWSFTRARLTRIPTPDDLDGLDDDDDPNEED